eukprot:364201-Chlamydomonas_euryale.AAC.28
MHVLGLGPALASASVIGLDLRPRRMFCARTTPPQFHMRVNARDPSCIYCMHAPHAWRPWHTRMPRTVCGGLRAVVLAHAARDGGHAPCTVRYWQCATATQVAKQPAPCKDPCASTWPTAGCPGNHRSQRARSGLVHRLGRHVDGGSLAASCQQRRGDSCGWPDPAVLLAKRPERCAAADLRVGTPWPQRSRRRGGGRARGGAQCRHHARRGGAHAAGGCAAVAIGIEARSRAADPRRTVAPNGRGRCRRRRLLLQSKFRRVGRQRGAGAPALAPEASRRCGPDLLAVRAWIGTAGSRAKDAVSNASVCCLSGPQLTRHTT